MTNTSNYNLLLAEGTDLVNYLTQTNPNFTSLDTIIKGVSDATVTTATEVTVGTAHAISRTLPGANVIRFVATSNWVTGDTMTVDGVTVSPLKTDGTTLKTGDYIIGATVIGVLDSTRFTVFVSSSPNANDINYDNSISGLSATKVQGALDEISDKFPKLLWTNPDSTQGFETLNITLNSNDYDYLIIDFKATTYSTNMFTQIIKKGSSGSLQIAGATGSGAQCSNRPFSRNSDTNYTVGQSEQATGSSYTSNIQGLIIPTDIFGFKL